MRWKRKFVDFVVLGGEKVTAGMCVCVFYHPHHPQVILRCEYFPHFAFFPFLFCYVIVILEFISLACFSF